MELSREDLRWALRRTPEAVLKVLEEEAGRLFVGGGFLRACVANEPASDVDLFAPNPDAAKAAAYAVAEKLREGGATVRVWRSDNAHTVRGGPLPIQVIHRWTYDTPEQLMASFDFTVAMAGFWWDAQAVETVRPMDHRGVVSTTHTPGWRSICDPRFYADLAAKRLRYTSPVRNEDAGGSMLRVLKFYQRGYRIPLDSLGAVVARLVQGVREYGQSEEDFAKVVTGLLREVDPNVDPEHIAHLPSDEERAEGAEKEREAESDGH